MGRGDTDAELFCRLQRPLLEPYVSRSVRGPEKLPDSGAGRGRSDRGAGSYYIMSSKRVMVLSKRKNGTYRAAAAGGWNPYGWGNGKGRKKPREVRTHSGKLSHEPKEIKRVRKMRYQCDQCGCYLDPGEGRTCDECQRKAEQRHRITERIRLNGQQYEMNMEELISCQN